MRVNTALSFTRQWRPRRATRAGSAACAIASLSQFFQKEMCVIFSVFGGCRGSCRFTRPLVSAAWRRGRAPLTVTNAAAPARQAARLMCGSNPGREARRGGARARQRASDKSPVCRPAGLPARPHRTAAAARPFPLSLSRPDPRRAGPGGAGRRAKFETTDGAHLHALFALPFPAGRGRISAACSGRSPATPRRYMRSHTRPRLTGW